KGFGPKPKVAEPLPSIGEDFEKRTQSVTAQSKLKAEVRFKAEVVSPAEWERDNIVKVWIDYILICANLTRWIRDQQESEGVPVGEDVYIILRLDGRVRRSGKVSTISDQI
ncbi:protein low psii accumulation1, partial [Trifolium pratense]